MAKNKVFRKGDVIMTTPQQGYYGIAIVLDDATKIELSPGRFSYPMNHIMITSLLFSQPITLEEICQHDIKPLLFTEYFNKQGERVFWREKICIDIYTNRNKANFLIIGSIDVSNIYNEPLLWTPMPDRFHLCGDVNAFLGREAYIQYCRDNNIELP